MNNIQYLCLISKQEFYKEKTFDENLDKIYKIRYKNI